MSRLRFALTLLCLASVGACSPDSDNSNTPSNTADSSTERYALHVVVAGTGSGIVVATNLECGMTCSKDYDKDAIVTLTANPRPGSTFAMWSGCDQVDGTMCQFQMTGPREVTATFDGSPGQDYQLSVLKDGAGSGTVTGTGISCGATCSSSYPSGTSVTLTATPDATSSFTKWTGCTSTSGTTCTVLVDRNLSVTATFGVSGTVVQVTTDITTPTTWTTGTIYEVTKAIRATAALTIQPGVLVRFLTNASLSTTSTITADGQSPTTPIIFTSAKSSPSGGDWGGITLNESGSLFARCQFLYAGANDAAALAIASGKTATVRECVFAHHRTPDGSIASTAALDGSDAAAGTVIQDNLFFDDRIPLAVNTTFSVASNSFDNSAAAPNSPQPSTYNGVFVRGCSHVVSSIIWPALTVPYVIGVPNNSCNYVTVDTAGTLTIGSAQAPATVKFFNGGTLSAQGTLLARATFTSIADDAAGGDTNGDGTATAAAAGDWNGVFVNHNNATIENCSFLWAGGGDRSALSLGSGISATVRNCVFAHNRPGDQSITAPAALDAADAGASTVLSGNVFYDNTVPLAVSTAFSVDDSNTFTATVGSTTMKNKFQCIVVSGCDPITTPITWATVKVPYVIGTPNNACKYLQIDATGHLTIADMAVLKFFNDGTIHVSGTLTANATAGIVFTGFADDAHGGDTNGDGASSAAFPGDWGGVTVSATGSVFNKVSFLYAGGAVSGSSKPALAVQGSRSITVTNCVFAHARTADDSLESPPALDVTEAASATVQTNTFFDDTVPLGINAKLSLDNTNTFEVVGTTPSRYNGIVVAGCGHVTSSTSWTASRAPFVIGAPSSACDYIAVDNAAHLTLGPNVTLKFFFSGYITVASGGLLTIDSTSYLTSIRDDHLTDTNGDANGTTPAAGDWWGVKYMHSGSDPSCDQSGYMHYQTANTTAGKCAW